MTVESRRTVKTEAEGRPDRREAEEGLE